MGSERAVNMANLVTPSAELSETTHRKTRGGRTLRYTLTVLQQPERARACGSGSKAASDRRPVDPPPVVELRIFELLPNGQGVKDITFNYPANFFLFATLEHARPIVHGRVQTPAALSAPVLTGMPVSGMAYLDRPSEAGYFLFPDLSVRHEGMYRLTFSLYEEIKNERDFDEESGDGKGMSSSRPSFDWRMEAKSIAFSVYSAKKFPGLTESTALSRTVAEQGCRVRIRRDVRMRRRDKAGGDFDNNEEAFPRRRSTRTPERAPSQDPSRARSQSAGSEQGRTPCGPEHQRRPSGAEQYPQPPPVAPQPPPSYNQPSGHLGFGNSTAFPSYQAPNVQPPPISPTTPVYPSASHPSSYPTPPSHGYPSRPSSQSYSGPNPLPLADRNTSGSAPPPSPHHPAGERRDAHHYLPPPLAPSPSKAAFHPRPKQSAVVLPPITSLTSGHLDPPSIPALASITAGTSGLIEADPNPNAIYPYPVHYKRAGDKRTREASPFETRPYHNGARQGEETRDPRDTRLIRNLVPLVWESASGSIKTSSQNDFPHYTR